MNAINSSLLFTNKSCWHPIKGLRLLISRSFLVKTPWRFARVTGSQRPATTRWVNDVLTSCHYGAIAFFSCKSYVASHREGAGSRLNRCPGPMARKSSRPPTCSIRRLKWRLKKRLKRVSCQTTTPSLTIGSTFQGSSALMSSSVLACGKCLNR